MAVQYNKFVEDAQVNCSTGPVFRLVSDSSSPDYSVLSIDQLQLKLSQQDLLDIVNLISRQGFARLNVK